jgi:adenosyl cobinamide kinase/adenosyl cobinamide phosphate guanylyltransferase
MIATPAAAAPDDVLIVDSLGTWPAAHDQLGRTAAAVAGRAERAYLGVAGYAVDPAPAGRRVSG